MQETLEGEGETAAAPVGSTGGGVVEWQCPLCSQTRQTPGDVRDHITMSTEGEHMGVSGWSISEDITGYNANGEAERVIEGFSKTVTEEDTEERGYKKKQIVNAYLADFTQADVDAVTAVTDASRAYVYRVLGELHEDEFSEQEILELQDNELIETLGEELDEFHSTTDSTQPKTMDAQSVEVTNEGELADEDKLNVPRGEGRSYLYNILMAVPEISYTSIPKVLDMSKEYARRTFKEVREGEVSASEVEEEYDESLQRNLLDAFEIVGELEGLEAGISDTLDIEQESTSSSSTTTDTKEEESEEEWPEFDERSKVLIINLYELMQEHGEELSPSTLSNAANCGYEYARRTLRELEDNDIPEHEYNAELDTALQNSLLDAARSNGYFVEESEAETAEEHERADAEYAAAMSAGVVDAVTTFDRSADGTAQQCVAVTADDSRCAFDPVDDSHFCGIHQPDEEKLEETEEVSEESSSEEVSEEDLPDIPGSGRDALLTVWTFNLDLTNEQAGKAAGVSGEYARRIYNQIGDGDISQSDIDEAATPERKEKAQERLEGLDLLEEETISWTSDSDVEQESTEEVEAEADTDTDTESDVSETVADDTEREQEESVTEQVAIDEAVEAADDMVPAAEIERIKGIVDVLLEQARYEGEGQNKKAEFIADKVSEELEAVLEN